jgi:nucleoside-diphosphate-sugar epimerase
MPELHVIFGSGQMGTPLATRLLADGKRVRVVRKSAATVAEGAETRRGDALDATFCAEAAAGASVVYHCMNPAYSTSIWAEQVPRYMENLIAAAGKTGARLVVLDNLYMLGKPAGRPLNEETPVNPCSRKGEVRARTAERLFDAHCKGEVRAVTGRASDFYGPGGGLSYLGDYFWRPALKGKTVWLPIDPGAVHTNHYIPDVAAALAILGSAPDDALGSTWMLPCRPAESMRDLVERLAGHLGRPIKVARVPRPLLSALSLLVPLFRELQEMAYQWDEPFVVDDRRFRDRFGLAPAGADDAARATVEWARATYPI